MKPTQIQYKRQRTEDDVEVQLISKKTRYNFDTELFEFASVPTDSVFTRLQELTSAHVTSIASGAFASCLELTSAALPEYVTSIESSGFDGCSQLTSVKLPDSLTSIDDYAFHYCRKLTSMVFPNSLTTIGMNAFGSCGITSITLPETLVNIDL